MAQHHQALVLARFAQNRSQQGQFAPRDIEHLFYDFALPEPSKISNLVSKLDKMRLLSRDNRTGLWQLTPLGRQTSIELFSDLDLAAFTAESALGSSILGQIAHTIVPPTLAPPGLIKSLGAFLEKYPFETNVFGMTRFPDSDKSNPDPVSPALEIARNVCSMHGLHFHLASDRALVDDLWSNVAAHMWACQFGVAFFENRRDRGMNYNLTIEVGSMLMTGRRCALLKDCSTPKLPTDLVGQIYKGVDLGSPKTVAEALHVWIRDDLNLGSCPECAPDKSQARSKSI